MGQSSLELIQQKKSERIVDVLLERLRDGFDSVVLENEVPADFHEELTELVQRVMSPDFEDIRDNFNSSNIACIAFDGVSRTLQIDFHSGSRYHYYGVEPNVARDLLEAESKGKYFTKSVKPNYPYAKVP